MTHVEQFIVFGKAADFNAALTAGEIKESSIVFIEDTKQIWTQGTIYSCPFTAEKVQDLLDEKVDKVTGKSLVADDLITKLTGLKTQAEITKDIDDAVKALDATVTSTDGKNVQVKVTETDGKITAVNITTDNTAKQADLAAEVTRATKAEEAIQAALDSHKADEDKKHIPEGGHERQILAWESDGTAKWDDMSNLFTGLEELLAYGVEWDITVADPHLTRIGNMSLHKTLPIQSQLKGCIAQKDKVIYWLDENDWRFKHNSVRDYSEADKLLSNPNHEVQVTSNGNIYTVELDLSGEISEAYENTDTNIVFTLVKENGPTTNPSSNIFGHLTVDKESEQATLVFTLPDSESEYAPYLTNGWAYRGVRIGIGSRLDGYDGTVRVYCPAFYIKSKSIGNKRQVWLSTVKIDNTWTYQHEILIDAYRSTVLNTVPENMGYLSTLPVNSAISVVNTATYCRGGGNSTTYDQYLETDPCRTGLGKPRTTGLNRATMRQYARKTGSYIMSYDQYKNIMYWLYVVEYANFNSQEAFNSELTAEGYRQGGMGPGVTTINGNYWNYYNGYTPLTPCGYLNEIGNNSGIKAMTLVTPTVSGGEPTQSYTFQVPRWRGFDNPFGDIWTNLDGIIIDADADNHPNNMNYVYTCQDPDKFGETLTEDWEKIGEEIHQDGYTKLFDLGDAAHIIPKVMGGNTTTYKCDYHWTGSKNNTLRALLVGSRAYHGTTAGLGYFYSSDGVSDSWSHVGFRSVSSFLSFSESE